MIEARIARRTRSRYCLDEAVLGAFAKQGVAPENLRGLFYRLLDSMPDRMAQERLPDSVLALLNIDRQRIRATMQSTSEDFFDLRNDAFLKDLAVLLLNLLPCGAEYVQVQAGVPRSVLFRGGMSQVFRGLRFFALRAKGFAPYLALHMDVRFRDEFNPEGWHRTYLRIADLLRLRPELKGVFGSAWFYDPAMSWVSPHLAYLREERESAGAITFRYGPSESALRNALARSKRRRQLYEDGRYMPMSHYIVWLREDLLLWADRQPSGLRSEF